MTLHLDKSQLEQLVALRTQELSVANELLRDQVAFRERAERILMAEARTMEMIFKGAPLNGILTSLCLAFEAFSQGGLCSVLIVDKEKQTLRRDIPGNLPPAFAEAVKEVPISATRGSSGAAAFGKREVVAEDIASDPNWAEYRDVALANGIRSSWSAPIMSAAGQVFGTFALYYRDTRQAPSADQALVERATHLAAIAFEREESQARLQYLASHDTLTHLPNRHLFQTSLSGAIARAQRANSTFALMFIDLDRFKQVNDELGHEAGDELLKQVAQRLAGSVRAGDMMCRFGGDEFVAILENLGDADYACGVAEKLTAALARRFDLHGQAVQISCSIGIALYPRHGLEGNGLLKKADAAMYRAKTDGSKRFALCENAADADADPLASLEAGLRGALERNELSLRYQPQYAAASGRIAGVEALVQWHHGALGVLPAFRFMPLAEDTGLVVAINNWVIREACLQNRAWYDAGHRVRIAVNVSGKQLRQAGFCRFILGLLAETDLPPELLELELNESIVLDAEQVSFDNLAALKAEGVYITVNEFGTGYSSLAYLKRLPVSGLKIVRSLTQDVPSDQAASSIVHALLSIAKGLQLEVTAIDVERREQVDFLAARGCGHSEGQAVRQPISATELGDLLQSGDMGAWRK